MEGRGRFLLLIEVIICVQNLLESLKQKSQASLIQTLNQGQIIMLSEFSTMVYEINLVSLITPKVTIGRIPLFC